MSARKHPSNLRLCPEVGIRSLKDLTKDELIYCINAACTDEYRLHWALLSVADKRQEAKWRKEDEAMAQHSKLSKELMALVSPYEGMTLSKVPHDVVLKADALARRMQRLEKVFSRNKEVSPCRISSPAPAHRPPSSSSRPSSACLKTKRA